MIKNYIFIRILFLIDNADLRYHVSSTSIFVYASKFSSISFHVMFQMGKHIYIRNILINPFDLNQFIFDADQFKKN